MKNLLMAVCTAVLMLGVAPASAGSRPATEGLNDVWAPNRVSTEAAIAAEIKRSKGYGPANVNQETHVDQMTTHIYNTGPQISSGATNVNNGAWLTTNANVGDNNNGVTITPSSVSRQNSGTTTQGANAQASSADNGGSVDSNASGADHTTSSTNSDADLSGSW